MAARKGGLNKTKGLGSLIPSGPKQAEPAKKQEPAVKLQPETLESELKLSQIIPNTEQPRKDFDEEALNELAASIKQFGVISPLLVQKKGNYYEIIAGERRWRAAKLAGLKKVPVLIKEYSPQETVEVSLIENIQRENLNAIEEANAYRRLIEEFGLKQEDIAKRVSKSRAAITNSLRLLKLDERVQAFLIDDLLSSGHARALLALDDPEQQFQAANRIVLDGLNVRDTERLVKRMKNPKVNATPAVETQTSVIYESIEERLKFVLGTKVAIKRKAGGKGAIEIEYFSQEELERLLEALYSLKEES